MDLKLGLKRETGDILPGNDTVLSLNILSKVCTSSMFHKCLFIDAKAATFPGLGHWIRNQYLSFIFGSAIGSLSYLRQVIETLHTLLYQYVTWPRNHSYLGTQYDNCSCFTWLGININQAKLFFYLTQFSHNYYFLLIWNKWWFLKKTV